MYVFRCDFFVFVGYFLLFYVVYKKVFYFNVKGILVELEVFNVFKFEWFIFDLLFFVKNFIVVEVEKGEVFVFVKNLNDVVLDIF